MNSEMPFANDCPYPQARILILDDLVTNVEVLAELLDLSGYEQVYRCTRVSEAREVLKKQPIDLILLDHLMPECTGIEFAREVRTMELDRIPRILMVTADHRSEVKYQALQNGVHDFLYKPIDTLEVLLRIGVLLEAHFIHQSLQEHQEQLELLVTERTRALRDTLRSSFELLAGLAESRTHTSGKPSSRVGQLSEVLGLLAGLNVHDAQNLREAVMLHDIGKIAIPEQILTKPGKLTDDEFKVVKEHAMIGAQMLRHLKSEVFDVAAVVALTHHERWNGSGYPNGLKGEQIPLVGRIAAIADVFHALTSDRPYNKAWTEKEALEYLQSQAGVLFDPDLVDLLVHIRGAHPQSS